MKEYIIILAAGKSTRLRQAKQLVKWKGQSLINHLFEALDEAGLHDIIMVTGAYRDEILKETKHQSFIEAYNPNYDKGMASSILSGVKKAIANDATSVMICSVDQYKIPITHYQNLSAEKIDEACPIAYSSYDTIRGIPAKFYKSIFNELIKLEGDKGAKSLFYNPLISCKELICESAVWDVDTEGDLERLKLDL